MKKKAAVLAACAAFAAPASHVSAATLYLKGGTEIPCSSFWKKERRVFVLVNRDTLIDVDVSDVDVRRTGRIPVAGIPKQRKTGRPKGAGAAAALTSAVAVQSGEAVPAEAPPAAKTDVEAELSAAYGSLVAAAGTGNMEEIRKQFSAGVRDELAAMEKRNGAAATVKLVQETIPGKFRIAGSSLSPNGTSATLRVVAVSVHTGKDLQGEGAITFLSEKGSWKVENQTWTGDVPNDAAGAKEKAPAASAGAGGR